MAEGEDEVPMEEEPVVTKKPKPKPKPPCNYRIHELAKPKTVLLLNLWYNYRHFLTPEKCRALKQTLQEEFCMSPEDAERYFEEVNNKIRRIALRRMQKRLTRKKWKKQIDKCEIRRAYKFFRKFIEKCLVLSYQNPVPPLIPSRLKNVMDIVLEQICELHNVDIPTGSCKTKKEDFLISLAYNIAAAIENIYYEVNALKNMELEEIEKQEIILKEAEANKTNEDVIRVTNF